MNRARIVVLAIAIGAGGVAAYLASGSDDKPAPAQPVAQLQTVDILVAKSDIGLGQSVKPDDLQWQTWPAATASGSFINRASKADAIKEITGSIARYPFIAGEPIREPKLAGQIWVAGEPKVRAYATPKSTLAAIAELARAGKKVRVAFVHDRESGLELFANKAF